jgi:ketosteroid isomerase-like protein
MDLWQRRLAADGTLAGAPQRLTTGVEMLYGRFSPDGRRLAYAKGRQMGNIWRVPIRTDRPATWADAQQLTREQAAGMASIVAEDVVTMPPNLPALEGKKALRVWWQAGFDAARSLFGFTPTGLVIAGEWAIDRFAWTMGTTPSSGGETTRDNGDCLWIWRKNSDGSWLLARAIWNSDNAATGMWAGASRS